MSNQKPSQKAAVSKTTSKTTSKTPVAKVAAVTEPVTEPVTEEKSSKKERKSKAEIFEKSLLRIRSTGDASVDEIAKKVLIAIHSKTMNMVEEKEGFVGKYNDKVPVAISRTVIPSKKAEKRETARYILKIGEGDKALELGGAFAAKAYRFSKNQHKVSVQSVSFNKDTVASIAALLD